MGLDTLFLIKTRDREFRMGGKYMAYDCFYCWNIKCLEKGYGISS